MRSPSLQSVQRRWGRMSIRNRLTAAAALAAAVSLVAVTGVAYLAVRHVLLGQIDSQLRHQTNELTFQRDVFGDEIPTLQSTVGDVGGYVQTVNTIGNRAKPDDQPSYLPVATGDLDIAQHGGKALRDVMVEGKPYRMLTEPVPGLSGHAVQLALPLSSVERQLSTCRALFLLLTALGLATVASGSWLAVRRTMRPVRELTDAAEQIAITRDLSTRISTTSDDELGRLARSFNFMLDALDRSLGQQRQLVLDASHELRTPLASLRTNAELLNQVDEMTPEQRRKTLDGIVVQLDELTGLVADVVELARGEVPSSQHEDVQFDELVQTAVERSRRHWPMITFTVQTVPVVVRGVPSRLDRAVANLLDNAGKFSPEGTTVEVVLDGSGRLLVADRGPGIPDDALPHVFDRFYRSDDARAMPGSGLGLAIVKQIVDGHHGTISLGHRPAGGTVALLTLPVSTVITEPIDTDFNAEAGLTV